MGFLKNQAKQSKVMKNQKTHQQRAGNSAITRRLLASMTMAGMAASFTGQASTDYGPAVWRPICNANYYTSGSGHKFHVIHDIEGYYASTISWFTSCGMTSASVHYAVNGKKDASSDYAAGEVTQLGVRDSQYAWHARCWNTHSTGTEHEGFASNPAWFTPELYAASAGVTRNLATKFGWARDRNHVVSHGQKSVAGWPAYASANLGIDPYCNTHTDPGPYWDWTGYMAQVNAGSRFSKPAVFRAGWWYLRNSNTTGAPDNSFAYGNATDTPVMGDWTGKGTATPGIVRNDGMGGLTWNLRNFNSTGAPDIVFTYGAQGDIPIVGDWDGNGTFTPGVVRGGIWYLRNANSNGGVDYVFNYGNAGDKPVTGDWDGNGTFTPGVVRNGYFYLRNSNSTGAVDGVVQYGNWDDIPIVGDWNGDRCTTVGICRAGWRYLANSNITVTTDISFTFGNTGDIQLVWW
jgi:N-acetyl-anhydromuramyl-L-alanine amidase AmpD